jgi:hypothetical protein
MLLNHVNLNDKERLALAELLKMQLVFIICMI